MDQPERTAIYDLSLVRKSDKLRGNMLRYRGLCITAENAQRYSKDDIMWCLQTRNRKNDFEAEHLTGMTDAQKQQYLLAAGDLNALMNSERKKFNQQQ